MSPAAAPRRRDRALIALLLLASVAWLARSHWETIEDRESARKHALHAQILAGEAPDPYQYKCWLSDHALAWIASETPLSLDDTFRLNTLLGLLALLLAHHLWLRTYVGPVLALVGGLLLVGLCHVLFRSYYHHPYEYWGVAGWCLLLRGAERERPWWLLALGALLLGLVWEKQAMLAPLYGLLLLCRRRPFARSLFTGMALLAAALVVPVAVRWHLGDARALVDGDSPLAGQELRKILWYQLPYLVPFLAILALAWRSIPAWVRIAWLALPLTAAAYISQDYIVYEVRSFWLLAPVFTATTVCWLHRVAEAALSYAPSDGPSGAA